LPTVNANTQPIVSAMMRLRFTRDMWRQINAFWLIDWLTDWDWISPRQHRKLVNSNNTIMSWASQNVSTRWTKFPAVFFLRMSPMKFVCNGRAATIVTSREVGLSVCRLVCAWLDCLKWRAVRVIRAGRVLHLYGLMSLRRRLLPMSPIHRTRSVAAGLKRYVLFRCFSAVYAAYFP